MSNINDYVKETFDFSAFDMNTIVGMGISYAITAILKQKKETFQIYKIEKNDKGEDEPIRILDYIGVDNPNIKKRMQYCSHPLINGAEVVDHSYRLPIEITINAFYNCFDEIRGKNKKNKDDLQAEIDNYINNRTKFLLYIYPIVYENLYITEANISTSSNTYGLITMNLYFKEMMEAIVETTALTLDKVANPSDASCVNVGKIVPIEVDPRTDTNAKKALENANKY